MARLVRNPNGDEAFLCGLLGRIGQLVMAQCIPEKYARVIGRAEGQLPAAAAESEALGFDFHQVGGALLRSWDLPALIHMTVGFWGDPEELPEDADAAVRELTRIMHLAHHTTAVLCGSRKGAALEMLHRLAREFCGISDDEVDAFVVSLQEDVGEAAALLNVEIDSESYQGILDQARAEMVQISLGTAVDLHQSVTRARELEKQNRELEDLANTDKLTGIPNRAHFDAMLERVIEARLAGSSQNSLGLLVVDVDHFKKFNDNYGHQVGDEVLKLVAERLVSAVRETDTVARYGGEEFVVILPSVVPADMKNVAERARQGVGDCSFPHEGQQLSVTVSVGGACVRQVRTPKDGAALLSFADVCLYEAKNSGRNRCVCRELGGSDPE
jgi:diguanylate cyclase (GGDEF)-like protein